jgi:hypothetical protein
MLLVFGALSYLFVRPYATSVCDLKLLVPVQPVRRDGKLECPTCMRPLVTSVCGLKLLVYAVLSY